MPGARVVRVPTIVLGGEKDAVFSVAEQRALADAIPGVTFTLLKGVGHAVHWENPQALAAIFRQAAQLGAPVDRLRAAQRIPRSRGRRLRRGRHKIGECRAPRFVLFVIWSSAACHVGAQRSTCRHLSVCAAGQRAGRGGGGPGQHSMGRATRPNTKRHCGRSIDRQRPGSRLRRATRPIPRGQ